MTLSNDHRDYLLAAAIAPEVIDASGIYTREAEPTGIVFPWNDGSLDEPLPQLRPDVPVMDEKGRPVKYRFPKGAKMILNRLRDCGDGPALIVEGTKQQYTALSYAPEHFAVYGLSGCWNWTDADLSWALGRVVHVLFDGDLTTNKDVHQAATELAEKLDLSGAETVQYVRTTARGSDGLDDVLAKLPEDRRAGAMALWIGKALTKLPKAPAKKLDNPFFDKATGFQVMKATTCLLENQPAALTAERKVALYLNGVYHIDGTAFLSAVSKQLGDQYRPAWRGAMEEMTIGMLFEGGKLLPERSSYTKLNCKNGMLDLHTLELIPHSPEFMSTVQVAVDWLPDAKAPTYEAWLAAVCPLQAEDLEEVAATMLDPTRTPHKSAFLFGPSRSGKSTFLRLLQAIAGVENRTAVTLHDLSRDRFAAANVYGKILNSAADLSSAHVEDLSVFKMMTGEDPIHGNRKYGAQFTFTNQALFAFSANELPTVTESSRAYAERIKPFEFPHSYAGKENPALEQRMLSEELPGILVRWVKAYQELLRRGGYRPTDERVRKDFETRSDRVAQWVADVCVITAVAGPGVAVADHLCTGRREAARAFNMWAERNGGHRMGERKVFDRLGHMSGIYEVRSGRSKLRAFNLVVKDDPNADLGFSPTAPAGRKEPVAEVAVSEHPSHVTSPSAPGTGVNDLEGGEEKVHGEGALKVPLLPPSEPPYSVEFWSGSNPAASELKPGMRVTKLDNCGRAVSSAIVPERQPIALGFDLETASAEQLFTGGHEGPFVRLAGLMHEEHGPVIPIANTLIQDLNRADTIYGHNILGFDIPALAHHHGANYDALAGKAWDMQVAEVLVDPPMSKKMPKGYYGLDQLAERYGVPGKTADLSKLAADHGGYDKIPIDSRQYQNYLRGDLAATKAVYEAQRALVEELGLTAYAEREMRVLAILNRMMVNGWAIDPELLAQRVAEEEAKRQDAIRVLNAEYGVPLAAPDRFKLKPKADWPDEFKVRSLFRAWRWEEQYDATGEPTGTRQLTYGTVARNRAGIARRYMSFFPEAAVARGLAERIPGDVYASPWATKPGKEALVAAFAAAGARHVPTSAKTGDILTSADALGEGEWWDKNRKRMVKGMLHPDVCDRRTDAANVAVRALCEVLTLATGARSKYAEIARYVTTQGRVHSKIGAAQGSGRRATNEPSNTNMGIRGDAGEERGVLVADPGHVLLTCDLSQVDMRAVAALSQCPNYMKLFVPGRNAHREMSVVYFGEATDETYKKTKAINHKFNYGGGVKSTAEMNKLDINVVQQAYDARSEAFPSVMEWLEEVREEAASGRLLDNGFGRLMRPDPARAHTQGPALMGQGAARDIMAESLLRLVEIAPHVTPYLRGVVHDEVVLSVPEGEVEEWSRILHEAFTWEWRGVPILCEVGTPAFRWSECK